MLRPAITKLTLRRLWVFSVCHYSGKIVPLQWRHNEPDDVSNHQHQDCLRNRLIRRRSKKTSRLPVTGPLWGEFTGDRWIPRTKGRLGGKCFHLMTSSLYARDDIRYGCVSSRYVRHHHHLTLTSVSWFSSVKDTTAIRHNCLFSHACQIITICYNHPPFCLSSGIIICQSWLPLFHWGHRRNVSKPPRKLPPFSYLCIILFYTVII